MSGIVGNREPVTIKEVRFFVVQLQPDRDTAIVTEMFDCTEAPQGIRDDVADGQRWIPVMRRSLGRLAVLVEPK